MAKAKRKTKKGKQIWFFEYVDMDVKTFGLDGNGSKIPMEEREGFKGTEEQAEDEMLKRSIIYEQAEGTRKLLKIEKCEKP